MGKMYVEGGMLFAGPELTKYHTYVKKVFPEISKGEFVIVVRIKVKGDVRQWCELLESMVNGTFIPVDVVRQMGELRFMTEGKYVLVGFKANKDLMEYIPKIFQGNTASFGDGSVNIGVKAKFGIDVDFKDMLNDSPFIAQFIEGISATVESSVYDKTLENFNSEFLREAEDNYCKQEAKGLILANNLLKNLTACIDLPLDSTAFEQLMIELKEDTPLIDMPLKGVLRLLCDEDEGMLDNLIPFMELIGEYSLSEFSVVGMSSSCAYIDLSIPYFYKVCKKIISRVTSDGEDSDN